MKRLLLKPDTTPVSIFNPSLELFEYPYDQKVYTVPAYGTEIYPKYLADKLASTLADTIIGKRGVMKNYALDKQELLKEIYI